MSTKTLELDISTKSLSAKVSTIFKPKATLPPPMVYYTPKVWRQINLLIAECEQEVGWFGTVEKIVNDYLITEIFIPPQTVSGAETDILPEDIAALALLVEDPEKLYYWGHSHVSMGVTPSGQDESQIKDYLEHADVFIRGIYNKRGESKVDVYRVADGLAYECVSNLPQIPQLSEEETAALKAIINQNVKPFITTPTTLGRGHPGYYGGYYGGYNAYDDLRENPHSGKGVALIKALPEKKKEKVVAKISGETGGMAGDVEWKNPFIINPSATFIYSLREKALETNL